MSTPAREQDEREILRRLRNVRPESARRGDAADVATRAGIGTGGATAGDTEAAAAATA